MPKVLMSIVVDVTHHEGPQLGADELCNELNRTLTDALNDTRLEMREEGGAKTTYMLSDVDICAITGPKAAAV